MKLRMLTSVVKFAVVTAVMAGVAFSATAQTAPAPASAGGYKIGIVDRKQVFDEYGKSKPQWNTLNAEKTKIQADLDARFELIKKETDVYNEKKATLSDEERGTQETALSRKMADWKSSAQFSQKELDQKGELIIKAISQEINTAIAAIGTAENYHLILEADKAFSSVIYFSDTLNLTQQVVDYVKAHSKDAPAAATAKPASETSKPDPKKNKEKE